MPYVRKVPGNRVEPLAWLGKTDWITPTASGYRWSEHELRAILGRSLRVGTGFYHEVRDIINLAVMVPTPNGPRPVNRTAYSDIFFMSSKVLATGQKTIRLGPDWCEAFENTQLTLQFKDYRQPFPTMVVELPANYAESKFVPGSGDYPEFIAIHHEEGERVLLFEIVFRNSQMTTLISYRPDAEIESAVEQLLVLPLDDPGYEVKNTEALLAPFLRIALNAVVAMTYGSEWQKLEPTPDDARTAKTLKKRRHAADKSAALKARLRLGTLPEVFQFDQTIRAFVDPQHGSGDTPEREGTPKKPHWRRGHWRQQATGEGRTLREVRWIRPTLINAGLFKGDLKDTATTYVSS